MITVPFAYTITQTSTGIRYYGIKFAQGCQPSDLGTIYFSSSKLVKKLIKEEGKENFIFEIRKIFKSKEQAVKWETKLLKRINAAKSPMWFNKHNGDLRYYRQIGYKCSDAAKKNMSKPKTLEHRKKLKENLDKNRIIPIWTEERKVNHSVKMSGENNPNYGNSNHPGANKFRQLAKIRKGKTREEYYGKEVADKMKIQCRRPAAIKIPCTYCMKYIKGPSYMKKWHGDNCRLNIQKL